MFGKMTDVNIWSRSLSTGEVVDWSECKVNQHLEQNMLVGWTSANITPSQDLLEKTVDRDGLCKLLPQQLGLTVFPQKRNFSSQVEFCKVMGGELAVSETTADMDAMLKVMRDAIEDKLERSFFTGFFDSHREGNFVNVNTGEAVNPHNWADSQPNSSGSEEEEDCTAALAFRPNFGLNHDASCAEQFFTICNLLNPPLFQLRGFCVQRDGQPVLDSDYALAGRKSSQLDTSGGSDEQLYRDFVGVSGLPGLQTTLSRDSEGQWTFTNLWNRAVVAYTTDTQDYPLGTHLWHFTGNVCSDGSAKRKMNLHRAAKVGEFCCSNGVCIQMEMRCDGYIDCADWSDEHNCSLIQPQKQDKKAAEAAPHADVYVSHISTLDRGALSQREKTKVGGRNSSLCMMPLHNARPELLFQNVLSQNALSQNAISQGDTPLHPYSHLLILR